MKLLSSAILLTDLRKKKLLGFTIFVALACLLNPIFDVINHKFNAVDFSVYCHAAEDLLSGGAVYGIPFGDPVYLYKYSPFILLMFIPATLLPFKAAALIHILFLSFCYWYSFILVREILNRYFFPRVNREGWLLTLAALAPMIFLVRELHLGNVNIFLVVLILRALLNFTQSHDRAGSFLIGLAILTKPYLLLLLLPLLFRKKTRAVMYTGLTVLAGLLVPFLIFGLSRGMTLTTGWVKAITDHSEGFTSPNSLYDILANNFVPRMPEYAGSLILFLGILLFVLFILCNIRHEGPQGHHPLAAHQDLVMEWFILMAMIPVITNTDSNVFLLSLPVITFIIYFISVRKKRWLIPLMLILVLTFGGNSQDLLGAELSKKLFFMGLIGISNILMIILSVILFLDLRREKPRH